MSVGFLRGLADDQVQVASAGLTAEGVNPRAIEVMKEVGIDISRQTSKTISDLGAQTFDLVVTLCEPAREYCVAYVQSSRDGDDSGSDAVEKNPVLAGAPYRLHWGIPDPAKATGSDSEILAAFRKARDEIQRRVKSLVDEGYLATFREERTRLQKTLDSLEDGLLIHDDQKRICEFNRAAERITGFTREEVLGRDCHEVFAPHGFCGGQCDFLAGKPTPFDKRERKISFVTKDGADRNLKMVVSTMESTEDRPDQVVAMIRDETEVTTLRNRTKAVRSLHGMVAVSSVMQEVFETIRLVATSDYPTLILGESGTGKELTAHAIHNESRRKGGPFVPVNCGALPENILESELFGHVRGAFTGAVREKKGRFELAHKGTLFLDEVGELSPAFQVKLLRVLQEKNFEKVGGEKSISVDVRIISATNRNLETMLAEGTFREDLYYRLCVVPITIPPLRDRREDIPFLAEQILAQISEEMGRKINSISDTALDLLMGHPWPGNVRELINALQFASVRSTGKRVQRKHLPPNISHRTSVFGSTVGFGGAAPGVGEPKKRRNLKLTTEAVKQALDESGGNKVRAAKLLGVGRATLYRFLGANPID